MPLLQGKLEALTNKQTALIKRHHKRLIGKRNENELIVNNVRTKGLIDTGSEINTNKYY